MIFKAQLSDVKQRDKMSKKKKMTEKVANKLHTAALQFVFKQQK